MQPSYRHKITQILVPKHSIETQSESMTNEISTQTDDVAFHIESETRDNWTQHENIHLARIEQLLLEQATNEQQFLDSTR